jgi:GNAT superfamily N-acetyltransferase
MKPMPHQADVVFTWRGAFDNAEVNRLHAECFEHQVLDIDWRAQLQDHSLGWVCARRDRKLVGFVNVAWDGDGHAFVLDTLVVASARRAGIGTRLLAKAACEARVAGCEWLHVDFEDHLRGFYLDACGFREAPAGVLQL